VLPFFILLAWFPINTSKFILKNEPLAKVGHSVIPAKAGIQLENPGFRVALRLPGMTIFYCFQEFCKSPEFISDL